VRFAEADALHEVAGTWIGERRLVEHPALEAFSQLTGRFCAALGENAEEGYWGPVVRMLRRARWDAATIPLPLAAPATGLAEAAREAVPRLKQCRHVAPELAAAAEDLAERLTALATSRDDPLGSVVRAALAEGISQGRAGDGDDADAVATLADPMAQPASGEQLARIREQLDVRRVPAEQRSELLAELDSELLRELGAGITKQRASEILRALLPLRMAERPTTATAGHEMPANDHLRSQAQLRAAVLLKNGRCSREVQRALSWTHRPISILTPPEFMASTPLDLVVAVGPSAWFPPPVVRASRARRLVFVYPSWIRDTEPQESLLAGGHSRARRSRISRPPTRASRPFDEALPLTPAEDWVPKADWRAISAAGRRRAGDDTWAEPVDAWLFALASGDGVYLEAGDGSRAYIAEIDEVDVSIHQELTAKIDVGDFVVLRTEGEGDYVRPIADVILGTQAAPLRQMQADWKQQLGVKLAQLGPAGLRRALEAAGAVRASDQNIRQWLRPDSIRPRDPADFSAITAVIGARERFRELWDAMGAIDSAHRKAGFQVRALLVEEIRRGDRSALTARGWADFDVKEIEGEGALRVARVEGRAPDTLRVPRTRTRHPFPIGRDLWLG
jgi:hypothetical protein